MKSKSLKIACAIGFLFIVVSVFSCIKRYVPITPPAVPAPVTLKTGLLLYLPFNGTMADSSGNNNPTATPNGGSLSTDAHGNANSAYSANGTNQVLLVTNNGSIKYDSAYTLSFNVMMQSNYTRQCFVSMVDWSNAYGPGFSVGNTCIAYPTSLTVGANDSTAGCDNFGTNNVNMIADTTSTILSPGIWYNVMEVYRRGTMTVYVNGMVVATKSGTGNTALLCPNSQVVVGGWWTSDPLNLNGKIDEVRLYNRVLTADEISYLAKNL